MNSIYFHYKFKQLDNAAEYEYEIELDPQTLIPIKAIDASLPDWTKLAFNKCSNCPLGNEVDVCPLAARLAPVIDKFATVISHTQMQTQVIHNRREYSHIGSAQEGLSALIGLVSASSGCPQMEPFRPLARFHLPFSDFTETYYRTAGNYLYAQYLRAKKGLSFETGLLGVQQIYTQVETVNNGLAQRIRSLSRQDSAINSIIRLNTFAQVANLALDEELEEIESLFSSYLVEKPLWERT